MRAFEKLLYSLLTISIVFVFGFYFYNSYQRFQKKKYLYDEYVRVMSIKIFDFYKYFDMQYDAIRSNEAYLKDKKTTKGELVYDFSKYDLVPIMSYLNKETENELLIDAFKGTMEFIATFNSESYVWSDEVFDKYGTGQLFFEENNGIYSYSLTKKIITKESFNNIYQEYLNKNNYKSTLENFTNRLYQFEEINYKYNQKELRQELEKNYVNFYNKYENSIVKVIADDLNDFYEFIKDEYYKYDVAGNFVGFKKEIQYDKISLVYKAELLDDVYVTDLYTHSYKIDIKDVWRQTAALNYPKLYM